MVKKEKDEGPIYLIGPKKLKEMSHGEAMYHYRNDTPRGDGYESYIYSYDIKSALTGDTFAKRGITLEEFKGKWTIEGIFEEE